MNIKNRKSSFYLLIILTLGVVHGFALHMASNELKVLFISPLLMYLLPAIWFGGIVQLIQHTRGKSKRTLLNGALYYGMFLAIILFVPQILVLTIGLFTR